MCQIQYDITYEDLNPTFLFTCQISRKEPERLHSHDFIEIALILSGEGQDVYKRQTGSSLPSLASAVISLLYCSSVAVLPFFFCFLMSSSLYCPGSSPIAARVSIYSFCG